MTGNVEEYILLIWLCAIIQKKKKKNESQVNTST